MEQDQKITVDGHSISIDTAKHFLKNGNPFERAVTELFCEAAGVKV